MDMNKKERAQYIKDLRNDIKSIQSIPEEDINDFELVKVQRELGRHIEKMGFDVLKQQFFIKENIPDIRRAFNNVFQSFGDLYAFAEGKVYENACYFGYSFSKDEIDKYELDISKMNFTSFVSETMEDIDIRKNNGKVEVPEIAIRWKSLFTKYLSKLKNAKTPADVTKIIKNFYKAESKLDSLQRFSWETSCDALLFNWFMYNKNVDLIPDEIWQAEDVYITCTRFVHSLFIIYGEKLLDRIPKYGRTFSGNKKDNKYYSKFRKLIGKTLKISTQKGYNLQRDMYYITRISYFNEEKFCENTLYFNAFSDFAAALKNDLSDCDLINANLDQIDLSQYQMNENTKLGLRYISEPLTYKFIKRFIAEENRFAIFEGVFDSNNKLIDEKKNGYEYFCDFLHVVGYDLSDCDLLFCEGLENVPDILSYGLEKAKVTSEVLIKAGKSEKDIVHVDFPVIKKSTFPLTLQNEKETKYILSAVREKENTIQRYRLDYISDLHLFHKNKIKSKKIRTVNDIEFYLKSAVSQMLSSSSLYSSPIIIAGDIETTPKLYKRFIKLLSLQRKNVIIVPGNHELWSMSRENWHQKLDACKAFVEGCGFVFLHNCIAYMCDDYKWQTISEEEIVNMSVEDIRDKTRTARYLVFGGLGFSGYNPEYNANVGLYRGVLDIADDKEETKRFEALYKKIEQCFGDRKIIIATHTQVEDWLESAEYHAGWIYVNGHNHRNYFYDDGVTRVYADNQIGYKNSNYILKSISIDGNYDIFEDYSDGIHQITAEQYRDFARGKNIHMTFNRNDLDIFMLKKKGYYCFIAELKKWGSLCILNGGVTYKLRVQDIHYYYDHMEEEIALLESPITRFYNIQKKISDLIKSIDGSGTIHGCIIDIDFYNHIYFNPYDLSLHCYFAYDMVEKYVYKNLSSLLKANCPQMFERYKELTDKSENYSTAIELYGDNLQISSDTTYYPWTDIYDASRKIRSLQYLVESKVLRSWYDISEESKDLIFKNIPKME